MSDVCAGTVVDDELEGSIVDMVVERLNQRDVVNPDEQSIRAAFDPGNRAVGHRRRC